MFKKFFLSRKVKAFSFVMLASVLMPFTAQAATYTVASGDSLYTIGKAFSLSSSTIMSNSNLSSSTIYPGQVLNITGGTYVVKSGDSLFTIANRFNVSVSELKRVSNEWDGVIYPGQRLVLPATSSTQVQQGTTASSTARIPYTAADLDLLARLITAEAESEPYTAKVAVGAVVINRVLDSRFPNTLSGVIYEKSYGYYQFTPVENGWINKPASAEAKKAAYEALHGNDPTKGAVYYFDDSTTNRWLWSKPLALRVGHMVYVY